MRITLEKRWSDRAPAAQDSGGAAQGLLGDLMAQYGYKWILGQWQGTDDEALQDERDTYAMGRTIGILERLLLYTLVLLGQWSALGFVLAAIQTLRWMPQACRSISACCRAFSCACSASSCRSAMALIACRFFCVSRLSRTEACMTK